MINNKIEGLIGSLYDMIDEAWAMPLGGGKCVVERDKVLDILDEVRASLPSEFKMSKEIVDKRNEIISSARKEHDNIKKQAEEYAVKCVAESEITLAARKKAAEIIAAAETRAKEITQVTNLYCDDAMRRTEEILGKALGEVKQSHGQFMQALKEQKK